MPEAPTNIDNCLVFCTASGSPAAIGGERQGISDLCSKNKCPGPVVIHDMYGLGIKALRGIEIRMCGIAAERGDTPPQPSRHDTILDNGTVIGFISRRRLTQQELRDRAKLDID